MNLSLPFNRRSRLWLPLLLVVLTFPLWQPALASFLAIQVRSAASANGGQPGQRLQMEDIVLSQFNDGRLQMRLTAASVFNSQENLEDYQLHEVHCILYDEQDRPTTISGGEALFAQQQQILTIVDNVELFNEGGKYRLSTDALRYLVNYQVVKTATPVHLFADEAEIHGNSMMYDQRSGDFRVSGKVVCRL